MMRSSGTHRQRERIWKLPRPVSMMRSISLAAVDDLAAGGEVGHGHVLEQVAVRGPSR